MRTSHRDSRSMSLVDAPRRTSLCLQNPSRMGFPAARVNGKREYMKRILALVTLGLLCSATALANSQQSAIVRTKHHVKHHHAHKAGKHHTPKRQHRTT